MYDIHQLLVSRNRIGNAQMGITEKRNYCLDVLKIIATVIIVFHHYQQIFVITFPSGINYFDFVGGGFNFAYIVELFFVLSGYLLYKYVNKINEGLTFNKFISKRLLRLLPMLAISAMGYEIVIALGHYWRSPFIIQNSMHVTVWGFITCALGIQEGWGVTDYWVNHPIWYVSVLIWCYVLFFFVTWLAKKLQTSPVKFYVFIIILGIGVNTYSISLPFLNAQMSRGYTAVFTGVILASLITNNHINVSSWKVQLASLATIAIGAYCYIFHYSWVLEGFPYLLTFVFYPAICIAVQSNIFKAIFKFSWIGIIGRITFDVYIWHCTVLVAIRWMRDLYWFDFDLLQRKWMYFILLIVILVGTVSYFFIETPINKWISKKSDNSKKP